jgi:peptidoglycan/LPS O-acetylase OafA/YrhL
MTPAATDRRLDLDWLRIIAFGLLILYHTGMFYVTWDFHVKSSRASATIEPLMLLINPWRLTLLMFIAGAATRFLSDKLSPQRFAAQRLARLLPPLLLAMFVIVPPQSWYELVEAIEAMPPGQAAQGPALLADFYIRYVSGTGGWCDADGCLLTPTYNHMWFVAYLIVYTLAIIPLLPLLRRVPAAGFRLLHGPLLILVPWLVMAALRLTLFPIFGETHDVRQDWYLHALYFTMFLFGYGIARHQPFFDRCVALRWPALGIALVCWLAVAVYDRATSDAVSPAEGLLAVMRCVHELDAWCAIVAAIGFAHRHLRGHDGPLRRTLTEAIFPFYLIHQTIIVVAGHHLDALGLSLWVEVPLLMGATMIGCRSFYAVGRRVGPLRPWIGLPRLADHPRAA